MKLNAALAKTLLMVASVGMVVPIVSAAPAKPKPGKQPDAPATPAAPGDEAIVIPGTVVSRANGGFLSIQVENGCLKLSFYDAKKKIADPDVDRAAARWNPKYKVGDERRVLVRSEDGKSLISPVIRPPYNFKLFLTLLSADDKAVESYTVDLKE
jgi:hypothetical protein